MDDPINLYMGEDYRVSFNMEHLDSDGTPIPGQIWNMSLIDIHTFGSRTAFPLDEGSRYFEIDRNYLKIPFNFFAIFNTNVNFTI